LGSYREAVEAALADLEMNRIVARIWSHDFTLWKSSPDEITNRLGWLHAVEGMQENLPRLHSLGEEIRKSGITHVLLLGMGGSSLAPEFFSKVFGSRKGFPCLDILDSTHPGAVRRYAEKLSPQRTLFIVSTKSGSTVETLSLFKFFYRWTREGVGQHDAGQRFLAITDPGSSLVETAERYRFRDVFLNDPHVGGRYSGLTYFGLVPAALIGVDITRLLAKALAAVRACKPGAAPMDNPGLWLGTVLGLLSEAGRDKATFFISPEISSFGDWVEQLLAESLGKEGKGILPVIGEIITRPENYGQDRLFVQIRMAGDSSEEKALKTLAQAGHPVVRWTLNDRYDIGGQFFLWEMATAVAGHILGVNPFDQPNVEAAKVSARKMVAAFQQTGKIPQDTPSTASSLALHRFLSQGQAGDYIAIQAYLLPTGETSRALQNLKKRLRDRYRMATTLGFGPRFLHSTGQLHKGDSGGGLFIQLTGDMGRDVFIPENPESRESSLSFGVLLTAAALGDKLALQEAGRRVISFNLGSDVQAGLRRLGENPAQIPE
jgi:glucose-6-phosphate isomerase